MVQERFGERGHALSRGTPLARKAPDGAHAARRTSMEEDEGPEEVGYANSVEYAMVVKARLAKGPT